MALTPVSDPGTNRCSPYREEREAMNAAEDEAGISKAYRKLKRRARFILEDFSDAECRLIVEKLIESAPQQTSEALCSYWEQSIEQARNSAKPV